MTWALVVDSKQCQFCKVNRNGHMRYSVACPSYKSVKGADGSTCYLAGNMNGSVGHRSRCVYEV